MDGNTFLILYDDVQKCVKERRLADALNAMRGLLSFSGNWEILSEIDDICRSYDMLLDYMENGYEDAERGTLLIRFFRSVSERSMSLRRDFEVKEESTHYAITWRTLQRMASSNKMQDLSFHSLSYKQMFDIVWTSAAWTQEDKTAVCTLLESDTMRVHDKCVLLSATMLSALHYFDVKKLEIMLDFLAHPNRLCRTRAIVGFVMIYIKYSETLTLYPDLQARMNLLGDDLRFLKELQYLQIQLFLSQNTKEVERQLREEIIPEMMKKAKHFGLGKKLGIESGLDSIKDFGLNPEWNESTEESSLAEKMRHLVEMQQKGADIFIGQFKLLKQKFPFFAVTANWFSPFEPTHPEIAGAVEGNNILKKLFSSEQLCDSDKYSFCLMLASMPVEQRELLEKQLSMATDDLQTKDDILSEENRNEDKNNARAIRTYVQDVYRFFKLFRNRDDRMDLFRLNLLLPDYPLFKELFTDSAIIRQFADFTFDNKSYLQASQLYERLDADAEIYQRLGYCYQQLHEFEKAIVVYERANLLSSDSTWTLRQLAFCYRMTGDINSTLNCYEQLEKLVPDDMDILQRLGECHILKGNYNDAFEKLYKVNYMAAESKNSYRALAWCSLLTGKNEQACHYYDKLLGMEPNAADYLNAGHAAWLIGNIKKCVNCYRKALSVDSKKEASIDFFAEDTEFLKKHGKSSEDILLMIDILNRNK